MQSQKATASQSASAQSGPSYESPYTIFQPVQSCQLKFSDPTTPFQHSNPAVSHGIHETSPQTTADTKVKTDTSPRTIPKQNAEPYAAGALHEVQNLALGFFRDWCRLELSYHPSFEG